MKKEEISNVFWGILCVPVFFVAAILFAPIFGKKFRMKEDLSKQLPKTNDRVVEGGQKE